jgi:hypothetical protein
VEREKDSDQPRGLRENLANKMVLLTGDTGRQYLSLKLLGEVIALEPQWAGAYSNMSLVHLINAFMGWTEHKSSRT